MGTPDFASLILEKLIAWPQGRVAGVVSQPDRRAGRGRTLQPTTVKKTAQANDLPLLQPGQLQPGPFNDWLEDLQANLLIVAAYGLLVPRRIISAPRYGSLNVHASLLPKYRGAAPIQRALINGDSVTGISIMEMEPGLDTGPILFQRAVGIDQQDTAQSLHVQLAVLGGECLLEALENWNDLIRIPQDPTLASYAPKLSREEGLIDWDRPADEVHNRIRGVHPRPGAYFFWSHPRRGDPIRLGIFPGRIGGKIETPVEPGQVVDLKQGALRISCQDRFYLIDTIRPASSKAMSGSEFFRGYCQDL